MPDEIILNLTVNGKAYSVPVLPDEFLSDVLRNRLGLTGTKIGCNEQECGACTVLVDDVPILSCSYPALRAEGRSVLTIEGLAVQDGEKEILHPLQEAFIHYGAVQCGFCTPGQIMMAFALLKNNSNPDSTQIRDALKDTLCRCGCYHAIENAVLSAAKAVREQKPVESYVIQPSRRARKVVGTTQIRPEALLKVTGRAKYTDDLKFENMLFGATKRAGVPHAILRSLNIEKAASLPGVIEVVTANDIPADHYHGTVIPDWPVLVGIGERVRYVGDAIALVAAETQEIADEALKWIKAEYDLRPVINNPVQAKEPGIESLHPGGNLLKHIEVSKGNIEDGFNKADLILEHTFHTPTMDHAFIEPECSIARVTDDGRMEVYVGSQIPYADRNQVARALGWPEERVRIIGMLIGGGFGGKEDIMGQVHAALLALKTGRPVKILYSRHESLIAHPKRHATQIRVKLGAMKNGKLVASQTELYGDTGAYASLGEKVMTRATTHSSGPYDIENVRADCYAMYTNNPPAGAFRGFGVLQSAFAIESMIDCLAEQLQMDPVQIRKLNALRVGSTTNTGQLLRESVGLVECIEKVNQEMRRLGGDRPFTPKPAPGEANKVRAWGFATAYKNTGLGGGAPDKAGAQVEIFPDGTAEIRTSSAELGQGLVTVLRMIVAEELALPPEKVRVLLSDTDLTPDGGPTTASRQTYVTGNAARGAAQALREAMASSLSEKYDVPPESIRFAEGLVQVGDHKITFGQAALEMMNEGRQPVVSFEYWAPVTKPLGQGGDMHFAFSFAAQAAEVEVDQSTGEVKVLRMITANDVGTAINPLGLQGQVEGGIMMGVGHTLTEHFIVEEGQVITDHLASYRIPSITMTPEITSFTVEDPTKDGPYGAKGVGEIVCIPTAPAITNAVYNAVGVRFDYLPIDQEIIVRELKKKL